MQDLTILQIKEINQRFKKTPVQLTRFALKRRFKIFKCESVLLFLYVLIYFYFPYAEVQLQKVAFTHVYFGPDIVSLIKQKFHTGSMLLLKYNFEYFLEGALEYNYGI